ncbi:hypothetical protein DFJ74DRAFT_119006 [Hyaloraphidium curvatum]|nr:hypothetical protein DFJ74DRAFT_119006 [Hyaloraphidium curvatum]
MDELENRDRFASILIVREFDSRIRGDGGADAAAPSSSTHDQDVIEDIPSKPQTADALRRFLCSFTALSRTFAARTAPSSRGPPSEMRARRPLLFPLLLLAASAAGADASEKINLRGTGTPYIAEPYKALSYLYPVTQVFRGVALAVPYTESSSGEGLLALRNGSMAWAAVDVPLSEQDLAEGVRLIPALAGGVAIVYNIRELRGSGYSLNVSQEALLGLFNGNITDVRDRRILSWNPYLASVLPANGTASTRLDVLYLSSTSSGEARILTAALSQISSEWNRTHGTVTHYGSLGILPASHGFSSDDLPGELLFRPYAVGFLDIGTANAFKLSTSKLQNAASLFVSPLPLHLAAAVNDFSNMVDKVPVYNSYVSMVNGRGLFSYPLVGPIYVAVRQHHPPSCSDAYELGGSRIASRSLAWPNVHLPMHVSALSILGLRDSTSRGRRRGDGERFRAHLGVIPHRNGRPGQPHLHQRHPHSRAGEDGRRQRERGHQIQDLPHLRVHCRRPRPGYGGRRVGMVCLARKEAAAAARYGRIRRGRAAR